jgi:hypothetical protein
MIVRLEDNTVGELKYICSSNSDDPINEYVVVGLLDENGNWLQREGLCVEILEV